MDQAQNLHSLQLPAATTIEQVAALREQWSPSLAAAGAGEMQVQAAGLKNFDTSVLALLLDAQRTLHQQGGRLRVLDAPPKFVELALLYGVDELLFGRAASA